MGAASSEGAEYSFPLILNLLKDGRMGRAVQDEPEGLF